MASEYEYFAQPGEEELRRLLQFSQGKLRDSLNEIFGVAQSIGLDTAPGNDLSVAVRRILRMTKHLSYALYGPERPPYRLLMNVGTFAAGFVRNLKEIAPQLPITMLPCAPDLFAQVAPEDLEMVLGTLVSNAARFGGDTITLQVTGEDDSVCITLADNGPGVSDPKQLFQWGYRTPDKNGRLGLGFSLPLARLVLAQQGAVLKYERTPAQTAFQILIERQEASDAQLAEWQPERLDNKMSEIRVELSDLMKEGN